MTIEQLELNYLTHPFTCLQQLCLKDLNTNIHSFYPFHFVNFCSLDLISLINNLDNYLMHRNRFLLECTELFHLSLALVCCSIQTIPVVCGYKQSRALGGVDHLRLPCFPFSKRKFFYQKGNF